MRFVVDAHLPRRMAGWLADAGAETVHTLDLPGKNRTSDDELVALADREERVLVTKDADFVNSHLLRGRPAKLLLISTGNISNRDLELLVRPLIPHVLREFLQHSFLELGRGRLIVRG